jgi:quinohemoprotein ethanol dehydrogenase
MSFHPGTGLVYIPVMDMSYAFGNDTEFQQRPSLFNTGVDPVGGSASLTAGRVIGALIAWDPLGKREVWRVELEHLANGGTLATAGNLVFQGTGRAMLRAYRATDGKLLWQSQTGTGVVAPPITYELDGVQYVAVLAGLGGGMALASGSPPPETLASGNAGRVLAWRLGGAAKLPEPERTPQPTTPIEVQLDPKRVEEGRKVYARFCSHCHGPFAISGGTVPDLRRAQPAIYDALPSIVLEGARLDRGMPSFADFLDAAQVADVRQYLLSRRQALVAEEAKAAKGAKPPSAR